MNGQRDQRDHSGENGVPVEDAVVLASLTLVDPEVRPERLEEILVGSERNAAHDISQGSAKENGEQQAGDAEDDIEESTPDGGLHVGTQFNANAAQHEQPEHDHERQVEAAETGGIEQREGEVEGAPGGEQPDFVSVPDRG